ncbi:sugar phosphate nucleotidyltransferase [Ilumatobacter sp.]|uniref:sugar phosphate nucleotidyltransferase n=1 Tax=Ilumatobacter sp. TaxID=1967498 RepID=UPI0037520EE2
MRAVVLVGGFGTRLRPLTNHSPKPMLPVGHRPMIERLVDRLARGGVTDVVLALGFKPEPFMDAFPDGKCGDVNLTYAVEPEPLDTGGAIRFAAESAGINETFVVANGDVLTDLSVADLLAAHRSRKAEATMHLTGVDEPSAFGVVALEGAADGGIDRIVDFVEKPEPGTEPSNLVNAGTYIFEPSVLDLIAAGERVSIERSIFPQLVEREGLYGFSTDDYWIDAGRPELYRAANLDLLTDRRVFDRCEAIAPTAVVSSSATITNSIIGEGVEVGAGAEVIDSVLLAGARVGAGARINTSLVMGTVEDTAEVTGSMVGAEGVVPAGSRLIDGALPDPAAV